jgi:electron transport complex protein RnfB
MKKQSDNLKRKTVERSRRNFLKTAGRFLALSAIGGGLFSLIRRNDTVIVWQLDPSKCVQCGRCATECVLTPSAVKCVHAFQVCGYCKLCGGFHRPNARSLTTAAENQLCPTGAIKRAFIEDPFYEYRIDEKLCIGCAQCVKGCSSFGNGSLYLQVNHAICTGCNECRISQHCPSGAFKRVPVSRASISKRGEAS